MDCRIDKDSTDDTNGSSLESSESGRPSRKRELSSDSHSDSEPLPDSSENPKKKSYQDPKQQEEDCFMVLFLKVINLYRDNFKGDTEIDEAFATIIDNFKYAGGNKYSDNDFENPNNIAAYFIRHGPVSAGLARYKISKTLEESEEIRRKIQNFTSPIKVLDLGTGHGCGTVGLCSALNRHLKNKKIHFTLVDHEKNWIPIFGGIEFFLRVGEFGEASKFFQNNDVSTRYLHFDLSRTAKEDEVYERSLNEADFIVISRVFSIAEETYEKIARNVVKGMKTGALLFFIDAMGIYPIPESFQKLKLIATDEKNKNIYMLEERIDEFSRYELSRSSKAKIWVYKKKN